MLWPYPIRSLIIIALCLIVQKSPVQAQSDPARNDAARAIASQTKNEMIIERNQIVTVFYKTGNLRISAEGRALGRGVAGDKIRVMNTASRNTLFARIRPDGSLETGDGTE